MFKELTPGVQKNVFILPKTDVRPVLVCGHFLVLKGILLNPKNSFTQCSNVSHLTQRACFDFIKPKLSPKECGCLTVLEEHRVKDKPGEYETTRACEH